MKVHVYEQETPDTVTAEVKGDFRAVVFNLDGGGAVAFWYRPGAGKQPQLRAAFAAAMELLNT